jgi:hypothetical protein
METIPKCSLIVTIWIRQVQDPRFQSYFTTGGSLPISFSWRHAPWEPRPVFFKPNTCGHSLYVISSNERTGVSFSIAADTRQRSHFQVRIPRELWPHFTVSDLSLPKPRRPGPLIYIRQKHDRPIMPSGMGFPFRSPPRLAGIRWRYSSTQGSAVQTSKSKALENMCCMPEAEADLWSSPYGGMFLILDRVVAIWLGKEHPTPAFLVDRLKHGQCSRFTRYSAHLLILYACQTYK